MKTLKTNMSIRTAGDDLLIEKELKIVLIGESSVGKVSYIRTLFTIIIHYHILSTMFFRYYACHYDALIVQYRIYYF